MGKVSVMMQFMSEFIGSAVLTAVYKMAHYYVSNDDEYTVIVNEHELVDTVDTMDTMKKASEIEIHTKHVFPVALILGVTVFVCTYLLGNVYCNPTLTIGVFVFESFHGSLSRTTRTTTYDDDGDDNAKNEGAVMVLSSFGNSLTHSVKNMGKCIVVVMCQIIGAVCGTFMAIYIAVMHSMWFDDNGKSNSRSNHQFWMSQEFATIPAFDGSMMSSSMKAQLQSEIIYHQFVLTTLVTVVVLGICGNHYSTTRTNKRAGVYSRCVDREQLTVCVVVTWCVLNIYTVPHYRQQQRGRTHWWCCC